MRDSATLSSAREEGPSLQGARAVRTEEGGLILPWPLVPDLAPAVLDVLALRLLLWQRWYGGEGAGL